MKTCKTYSATIHIAGDMARIKDACRFFCLSGLCVSIVPAHFVFTGGMEDGAAITVINYPRFVKSTKEIDKTAKELAKCLLYMCHQRSCSIVTPTETYYLENESISIPR